MISFNTGIQHLEDKRIPKIVYDWVTERERFYPNVDFRINCSPFGNQVRSEKDLELSKKYSMFFILDSFFSVKSISFPFLDASWSVRIIGLMDRDGKTVHPTDPRYGTSETVPLGSMRNVIAGITERKDIERVEDITDLKVLGKLREIGEALVNYSEKLEELKPNYVMTSQFSTTGAELSEMINNQKIGEQVVDALNEKDYDRLKDLKENIS